MRPGPTLVPTLEQRRAVTETGAFPLTLYPPAALAARGCPPGYFVLAVVSLMSYTMLIVVSWSVVFAPSGGLLL